MTYPLSKEDQKLRLEYYKSLDCIYPEHLCDSPDGVGGYGGLSVEFIFVDGKVIARMRQLDNAHDVDEIELSETQFLLIEQMINEQESNALGFMEMNRYLRDISHTEREQQ